MLISALEHSQILKAFFEGTLTPKTKFLPQIKSNSLILMVFLVFSNSLLLMRKLRILKTSGSPEGVTFYTGKASHTPDKRHIYTGKASHLRASKMWCFLRCKCYVFLVHVTLFQYKMWRLLVNHWLSEFSIISNYLINKKDFKNEKHH